ncbi:unnamed protein product [Penicillium salamii]|uniref:Uncharacterized protein n=1 Tax=Penicillium salamii TaxID=1612424 RepID=A0A9W4JSS8_9EURO|nr:unnamed protein product [Penicillium salamii]CAG7952750.1 unnamed protein product [Penicillium salamii]CAG8057053.1 unnamed protein product [Penicillium salamii]CAG8063625.1 unnamed protein product [Penicillium salamii]CAG8267327.1 unnamed protein product [Penicillium salamii]
MALVRDPCFWKRFSTAVHMDEESKAADQQTKKQDTQSWLYRERRKRKRSIICGFVIFFAVVFAVIAGVVIWWLAKNNWLQPGPDATA